MTRWDHVRGALIALVLFANAMYALPLPNQVRPGELQQHRHVVEEWHGRLRRLGFRITREQLEDEIVDLTARSQALHRGLKAPFRPLFKLTQMNQGWALFAGANELPGRLVVEIRERDSTAWEPVFRKLDPCCRWRRDQFRHRRLRGVWDSLRKTARPGYRNLVKWVARRAFEDFEQAEEVRVYVELGRSVLPWEPPVPERRKTHLHTFQRGAVL